jgi:uncharacterized protein YcnI
VIRRTCTLLALVAGLLLLLAAPASAHVDVGPETAVAGSTTTLTFSFHHGKDGAATTALQVQLPDGASVVAVPAIDGWTSSVTDGVVSWTGGRVPDGTRAEFTIDVRLPPTAGTARFPTIQVTEAGELAWISPDEGEGEDQRPAPRVELTADPDGGGSPATSSSVAPSTTLDLPRTAGEADERDDGSTNSAAWYLGSGLAALAAVLIGGTILRRRAGS